MFDLIPLINTAGYIGLFAIIFMESGVLIGLFLPGDSLLFTAGFLASQGFLNIYVLIFLFSTAAFFGDLVGYLFGKKVGPKIFVRPKSFWFNPENVEKTRRFYEKHGSKTIILARFLPVVRTLAPILAGVGDMKYRTFLWYNFIGTLFWAAGITTLGYLFGNVIPNADKYILPIVGLIIVLSVLPTVWQVFKERRKGRA